MPRSARQFLVASLVALHAAVMQCGPCLHRLPGWGHVPGLSRGAGADRVRDPHAATDVRADDCPVCHLFAQAQLPADPAAFEAVRRAAPLNPVVAFEPVTPRPLHLAAPRAPPT